MRQGSFASFWFPEDASPWFYLQSYKQLPDDVRRRYNQLYALGTNEVFAIFESDFISEILYKKIELPGLDPIFKNVVRSFCEEEIKHAEMFHQLNGIADAKLYSKSRIALSRSANPAGLFALYLMKKMPDILGAWIWLSFFLEERSLLYSKLYMHPRNDHLNAAFREAHKLHLLEENYHVQLDEVIIDTFYKPLSMWKRKLAAWMVGRLVKSFMKPRRLSLSIAGVLKNEFPYAVKAIDACIAELPSLATHAEFHQMTLGTSATARFRAMLSKFPEMKGVLNLLTGK